MQQNLENALINLEKFYNNNIFTHDLYSNMKSSLNLAINISKSFKHKLIITGINKNGKSSLINLLLKDNLLSTNDYNTNKFAFIIRYSEDHSPKLYSARINDEFYYNFEQYVLLADGKENIKEQLGSLYTSADLDFKYQKFESNYKNNYENNNEFNNSEISSNNSKIDSFSDSNLNSFISHKYDKQNKFIYENTHHNFIFILKCNSEFLKLNNEIWELPNETKLNHLILNNIMRNEININKTFPFLNYKRLNLIHLSDFSFNRNNLMYNKIENYCENVFIIINKIDQINSDNLEKIKNSNNTNNKTKEKIRIYYLSILYSYLECKELDSEDYWMTIKENIYDKNLHLKKEYNYFSLYKEYLIKNNLVKTFQENNFLKDFNICENDIINSIKENNFLPKFEDSYDIIINSHIFDLNNSVLDNSIDLENKIIKESNYFNLGNIQSAFSFYFQKIKKILKFELQMIKIKIDNEYFNTRKKLDENINNIKIFSKESTIEVSTIYQILLNSTNEHLENLKSKIISENENLSKKLEKILKKQNLKTGIINNFINQIETEIKNEIEEFNHKISTMNDILNDIQHAITNGVLNGTIAFLGTKCLENIMNIKGAGVGLISSTLFCVILGFGCLIYCSYKEFDKLNEKNRENFIQKETELWEKILKYKDENFKKLKEFVRNTKSGIKKCKYKINQFFYFVNKI